MIEKAKYNVSKNGLTADLFQCNVCELKEKVNKEFDVATCIGNVLAYLNNEEILLALDNIYGRLKENGMFMGDILNYSRVLENIVNSPNKEQFVYAKRQGVYYRNREIKGIVGRLIEDENCIIRCSVAYKNSDNTKENRMSKEYVDLNPITIADLKELFKRAGFSEVKFFKNKNDLTVTYTAKKS